MINIKLSAFITRSPLSRYYIHRDAKMQFSKCLMIFCVYFFVEAKMKIPEVKMSND